MIRFAPGFFKLQGLTAKTAIAYGEATQKGAPVTKKRIRKSDLRNLAYAHARLSAAVVRLYWEIRGSGNELSPHCLEQQRVVEAEGRMTARAVIGALQNAGAGPWITGPYTYRPDVPVLLVTKPGEPVYALSVLVEELGDLDDHFEDDRPLLATCEQFLEFVYYFDILFNDLSVIGVKDTITIPSR